MRAAIVFDCVFPATAGGGERVYTRIAEELDSRGFSVDYLTRELPVDHEARFRVVPVWNGEIYDADGNRTAVSAVRFAWGTYRHLRQNRRDYDLVIASTLPALTILAAWAALLGSRAFLVADWLEVWPWRKWRSYAGRLTGTVAFVLQYLAARIGRLHTVNSSFTAARLSRYRSSPAPLVLGLVDLVAAPTTRTEPSEIPLVLFVGRHIADKRVTAIPAALALVRRTHPLATAVIVGTGTETAALEAAIVSAGVGAAVRLAGRVDDDELDRLFGAATVLLNPSAREGFGLVVAEAASHGTPSVVVTGEDNAAVDLIVGGINGFVVASADAADLADGVRSAIDGGAGLRASTLAWFETERVERSLSRSVDEIVEIVERYTASRG
ncbi:MAG: glycosyltransferase family 4 protein [Ramlibacter sp.]|nr:glycosyltransferase family 4 protein [Cryobacterium sp.]